MTYRVTLQDSDIRAAQFIFCYFKFHGVVPSQQSFADTMGYTRQAAYSRFKRLMKLGVMKQAGHGDYYLKSASLMPSVFGGIYNEASDEMYLKLKRRRKRR